MILQYLDTQISVSSNMKLKIKKSASNRKSEIQNQQTGKGFMIKSSAHDGIANSFGKGDIWF
jgi:hypothetical protein